MDGDGGVQGGSTGDQETGVGGATRPYISPRPMEPPPPAPSLKFVERLEANLIYCFYLDLPGEREY